MEITVLFFARARELAATEATKLRLPDPADVTDAIDAIARSYPALSPLLASCRTAVDEEFTAPDAELHDGSVLAIIPPVSGG